MNRLAVSAIVGLVAVVAFVVADNAGYRSSSYAFHGYYPGTRVFDTSIVNFMRLLNNKLGSCNIR